MATRSTIALEYADGTVGQVYCHWDGYLDNNGKILLKHFKDPFKLQKLMDLGDLSSLRPEIGEQHAFSKLDAGGIENRVHNEEWCTFYGRDRGEQDTGSRSFKDFSDYVENHQYEEYEYILRRDGNWYVKCHSAPYVLLADAIANELIEAELAEDQ
jgi:hypothetical protein